MFFYPVRDDELPSVIDEVSIALKLYAHRHDPSYPTIFHKGATNGITTPSLWLHPNTSQPYIRFSINDGRNLGIDAIGPGIVLNKWYHLCYTLSEPLKRMDFYINGKWAGFKCIEQVLTQCIMFNRDQLRIGYSNETPSSVDFNGQMSNFRYYNWRLSPDEVAKDFIDTYE
nr:10375_t:CDS:2 [Entrophospora candida]